MLDIWIDPVQLSRTFDSREEFILFNDDIVINDILFVIKWLTAHI